MKDFDFKNKNIVSPKRQKKDPCFSGSCLLIPSPFEFDLAVNRLGLKQSKESRVDFFFHYLLSHNQKEISLVGPAIGAPAAVMLLEKLAVYGIKNLFVLGCCGSLQDNIKTGDLIIPIEAIREEGTSFHYADSDFTPRASSKITELVSEVCSDKEAPFHKGKTWTTDAPYRETGERVTEYKNSNVLGVEMELSALFTVAALKRIELGGLLVVSDELSSLKWNKGFHTKAFKSSLDNGLRIALKVLERLG